MAEMNREARYTHKSNKGGAAPGADTGAAKATAEKTAGDPPTPTDPKGAIDKGDPGPSAGHDATWGEVASRHSRQRDDMGKRHAREMEEMHARHSDEHAGMIKTHAKEMGSMSAPGEGGAEGKAEATAGSPKELGADKSESSKGSEP